MGRRGETIKVRLTFPDGADAVLATGSWRREAAVSYSRGVSKFPGGRYLARLSYNGTTYSAGPYETKLLAQYARDMLAYGCLGDSATCFIFPKIANLSVVQYARAETRQYKRHQADGPGVAVDGKRRVRKKPVG